MVHIINIITLKSIYLTYFHSILKQWKTYWGNSSNSGKICMLQEKIVKIVVSVTPRTACRNVFKE